MAFRTRVRVGRRSGWLAAALLAVVLLALTWTLAAELPPQWIASEGPSGKPSAPQSQPEITGRQAATGTPPPAAGSPSPRTAANDAEDSATPTMAATREPAPPAEPSAQETPEEAAARKKKEAEEAARKQKEAERLYQEGFALQKRYHTRKALESYRRALELNPEHARAHYEIGWSYWILERWADVVKHWEKALAAKVSVPELATYLDMARERLHDKPEPLVRPALHTRAQGGGVTLELVARFQHYQGEPTDPADHFDAHVFSPKSVQITPDGAKAYVQALEGRTTIVYDARTLTKLRTLSHDFDAAEAGLFDVVGTARVAGRFHEAGAPEAFNVYQGKPVEGVFSHGGRYLWVSHYRRTFDALGILPSSVAVIDTRAERIVHILQTGPIPKYLAVSPDGHWLAVVHWGDNTVGLFDIRGDDPDGFEWVTDMVVEHRLPLDLERKVDRDRFCGFCLRGAVFTADSKYLLVARMGGGGIAVLDVASRRHIGTVRGMKPTPRHLVLSGDGRRLYVGSNSSGYVAVFDTAALLAAARAGTPRIKPLREARTGTGTRTIALSPDESLLFAAVNRSSKLVALDARTLAKRTEISTDSFPVGLDVTPDGTHVWVTAQGYKLRGGNAVTVYRVTRATPSPPASPAAQTPAAQTPENRHER